MTRPLFLIVAAICLVVMPLAAQAPVNYEAVTIADTAVGITAATLAFGDGTQATTCGGVLETAQIRYRYDGTAPTAIEGTPLEVGTFLRIDGNANLRRFRGIRTGATSGVIRFHCTR